VQIVDYDLPSDWSHLYLVPLSDSHIGDPHFDEEKFTGYIDWIAERENALTFLNGDLLDAALLDSIGDTYDATMNPNQALKYAKQLLSPLKGKVLGVTEGNHEHRITRRTSLDVSEMIADSLDAPYSAEGMYLRFRLGKGRNGKSVVYTAYLSHGTGGGRTAGGKINALRRLNEICLADFYSIGHVHKIQLDQDVVFIPDHQNGNMIPFRRTYASSGAFLDYGGYGQRAMYSPNRTGVPRVRFSGKAKDVHVSI